MTPEQYALKHLGADYSVAYPDGANKQTGDFEVSCGPGGTFEEEHLQEMKNILGAKRYEIKVSSSGCRTCGGTEIIITYYGCTKL